MLVNRDQAERARGKGITEHLCHPRDNARRAAGFLGEHQIAILRVAQLGNHRVAPFAFVDGFQEMTFLPFGPLAPHNAEQHFLAAREFLHRVDNMPRAAFLGATEEAVADAHRRTLAAALDHPQARGSDALGLPVFGRRDYAVAINVDDPHHGDFWHTTHFVERTAGGAVDQPFIGHVLE